MKILLLGLAMAAASAFATTITFDTDNPGSTTFSCIGYSGGGNCLFDSLNPYSVRVDDLILTYTPNNGSVSAPPETSIGVGDMAFSCATGSGGCTAFANFAGVSFFLDVATTTPIPGNAPFSAVLTGMASYTSSNVRIPLVPASFTLDDGTTTVTFTPDQPGSGYSINPVSDGRPTSIQMLVDSTTANVVPEPGSMALLGGGLIGLGIFARRRSAR